MVIDVSSIGDVVEVLVGIYNELIDFIGKEILVEGFLGFSGIFLVFVGVDLVVIFVIVEGFGVLFLGFDIFGGNIIVNSIYVGGVIYIVSSFFIFSDFVIYDNIVYIGGGIMVYEGGVIFSDVVFFDNFVIVNFEGSWGYGGGFYVFEFLVEIYNSIV